MRTDCFPKEAFLEVLKQVRLHIGFFLDSCPYCVISNCSHKPNQDHSVEAGQLTLSPSGNDLFFKTFQ